MTLATNIAKVKSRITAACATANCSDQEPLLLAVSKTRSAKMVIQAFEYGLHAFGENYLQEALPKIEATQALPITWHFIGPIQSNKTKDIAQHFDWVHSVDRSKIALRLSEARHEPPLNVCIQVNISEEASKAGCAIDQVQSLAQIINNCDDLQLRGLMAIPAANSDNHEAYTTMHRLFVELHTQYPQVDTLSMGMSADLETAIAHGSTLVRIGTDIFGSRKA